MTSRPHADEAFEARIDAALRPPAPQLVAAYFDTEKRFAADTFNAVGFNDPNRITSDDLLAVTLLNVVAPPLAVRALLGAKAEILTDRLGAVPFDTPLWEATHADLAEATAVWKLIRTKPRIGPVTAGKLLARKRPLLIPVFDSVIQAALQPPADLFWVTLRAALRDEERRAVVEALRPPGLTMTVSTLRLLDVAVWMRFSESTNVRNERARLGLTVAPRRS